MLIAVKTDVNNVVVSYAVVLNNNLNYEGALLETDLDLDLIQLVGNYKVVDGVLVELTVDDKGEVNTPTQTQDEQIQILKAKSVNLKVALADLTDLVYMQHLDDLLI